ncbi:RnfH family protein [Methylonatrum kenyense]|uniref:RnfH family protein n=1 Tax=Methylonatrum kenyense TaxID=455253 RepID=UPI0020BE3222|nr:RnfH family protein [Methylonatrum kenyense]MCK8515778.1 RnfH family protein [Methylonatrum kenyense]
MVGMLEVEVAYALPSRQTLLRIEVAPGTTVAAAIAQSAIQRHHPEIDLAKQAVGIFGEQVPLDRVLEQGDRVEIYRPLLADPKEHRRQRARRGR